MSLKGTAGSLKVEVELCVNIESRLVRPAYKTGNYLAVDYKCDLKGQVIVNVDLYVLEAGITLVKEPGGVPQFLTVPGYVMPSTELLCPVFGNNTLRI
jgi:hypothetical protein